jgi:hypothetical protein
MDSFKLDRTSFKGRTLHQAADHGAIYKKLSWQERLKIAAYLNSVAYNFDMNIPPKMDRTKFSARSFTN